MTSSRSLFQMITLVAIMLWCNSITQAETRAQILAVFDVEDKTGSMTTLQLQQLSDYLSSKMAEGGSFQVIPGQQIKDRLRQQKLESYKTCYDQQCQIEIGRELAANKSLSTQIVSAGSRCAVLCTLYDLKRAASVASASAKSSCTADDLVASLERVTLSIKDQVSSKRRTSTGGLLIRSTPEGAAVFLDGVRQQAITPTVIPKLKAGEHSLRLVKGDYSHVSKVTVVARRIAEVNAELEISSEVVQKLESTRLHRSSQQQSAATMTRQARRRKSIRGYSALVAAAAAAAGAGVLYGLGFSKRSDADEAYMSIEEFGRQDEIDRHWADVESADRMIVIGHVLVGVSGALLGYSLYELLTRPSIEGQHSTEHGGLSRPKLASSNGATCLRWDF